MEVIIIYFTISSFSIQVCDYDKLVTMQEGAYCEVKSVTKDSVVVHDTENFHKYYEEYKMIKIWSQIKRLRQESLNLPKDDIQIDSLWFKRKIY